MDSAVTMVPTPCWMNSAGPIRSASSVSVAARPVQLAKQKTQRQRGRAETVVNERTELGQRPAQICESRVAVECEEFGVADAAHPPIDVLDDVIRRL